MITERLFMKSDVDPVRESSCKTLAFSVIEENAIYFAAGYVVQKLRNSEGVVTMMLVFIQQLYYIWSV